MTASSEPAASEQIVDSRGRRCPLPIIDLAAAARSASVGSVIVLIADDPAADADVPAWCRMRGQAYEGRAPLPSGNGEDSADRDAAVAYRVRILSA